MAKESRGTATEEAARDTLLTRGGVGGISRGIRQLSAKSRSILRLVHGFIFGCEVFSRGTNETRRGAILPGQDLIAGHGFGYSVFITIIAEQGSSQLDMGDGEVYIVGGERLFVAADHVAKELLGAGIVLLVEA